MTDATGTTTWGYDNANRTTSVAQPAGTLTYGYDNAGRRTSMTLPGSRQISYSYNTAGRLDTVSDWGSRWASFAYDAAGRRTSISRSNGVGSTIAYDAAGQTTSIVHAAGGNTLESFAYTYDAAGNRTGLTSPQGNETYSYDSVNRLTDVSYQGGPTVGYGYDAAGNRTSETRGGQTTNYTYDNAGQLTQVGSETYTFDGAGNFTQAGSDTYGWDHANRLTSASRDGHSATYVYDGTDVKTRSTVDSDTDDLLVDRLGGLPTVVDDGERAYVQAGGLGWQTSGSGTEFALSDGLGSVRGLTNASGSLVGSGSFDAFGAPRASSGTTSSFGFTGEATDASGLVDLRARALDPGIGRFLSVDTVRPNGPGGQGFNPYGYVANNPSTWVDPSGHSTIGWALLAVPFIIVAIAIYMAGRCDADCEQLRDDHGSTGGSGDGDQCGGLELIDPSIACPPLPQQPQPGDINSSSRIPEEPVEDEVDQWIRQHQEDAVAQVQLLVGRKAVIGEDSNRVIAAAVFFGAEVFAAPGQARDEWMGANIAWINTVMDENVIIIDIGPDPNRKFYPSCSSPFYCQEWRQIYRRAYPLYFRVHWPASLVMP
jgi:RHS repeat-associated protein